MICHLLKYLLDTKLHYNDNDNFGGESMVVTSDTKWIGTAFNDRVSSN